MKKFNYNLDANSHQKLNLTTKELGKILKLPGVEGNAKAQHGIGIKAAILLEKCREGIAELLNCNSNNLLFCSSCTEANNWMSDIIIDNLDYIVKSPYEHSSLNGLNEYTFWTYEFILNEFAEPVQFECSNETFDLNEHMNTCFIGVHNETGAICNFEKLRKISKFFCSDLCQAVGKIKINLNELKLDLATFGGHKFGGPNIGVLYTKELYKERGFGSRYGFDNVGSPDIFDIVCLYECLKKSINSLNERIENSKKFISILEPGLESLGFTVIGKYKFERSPFTTLVKINNDNISSMDLLLRLSDKGIYVNLGSACSSGVEQISKTMKALGEEISNYKLLRLSTSGFYNNKDAEIILEQIKSCMF